MEKDFTDELEENIRYAKEFAIKHDRKVLSSDCMIMGVLLSEYSYSYVILEKNGVYYRELLSFYSKEIRKEYIYSEDLKEISPRMQEIFENAQLIADAAGADKIRTDHVVMAMLCNKNCAAMKMIERTGITDVKPILNDFLYRYDATDKKDNVAAVVKRLSLGAKNEVAAENNTAFTEKYATDLVEKARNGKLNNFVGRESELSRTIQILSRRTKNNPILVGEPGVGKTAIVEELAKRVAKGKVPDALKNSRILSLDLSSVVAGTKYRGEFEEKMRKIIKEIQDNENVILFIDEIHTIVGAGGSEGALDAANIMKPALSRGDIKVIGATTSDEYRKYFEKNGALARRFQPVKVEEPTKKEALDILDGIRSEYEDFHNVSIEADVLEAAVSYSERYIEERFLPDKAIDLMDEAATRVKLSINQSDTKDDEDYKEQIREYDDLKIDAIISDDVSAFKRISTKETEFKEKIKHTKESIKKKIERPKVTKDDVAVVVSDWTKIPVTKITQEETSKLNDLESRLKDRIVGQDDAVRLVSNAVRRGRIGLNEPNRPIGSFLFMGPTGVGKTELTKALAEAVFEDEKNIIRIDMSEYMEKFSVSRLIGSPPGYVGYEEGGQLTEIVRKKPYSVILLDEIEKAHPDVYNILLQILDEGVVTDSNGRRVSFKNTIIIMTSNIGAEKIINNRSLGFEMEENEEDKYEKMRENVMDELKHLFRPELLNRIDEIIVFRSLNREDMGGILDIMLERIINRIEKQLNIKINVSQSAKNVIIDSGFSKDYGARPLKRKLQTAVEDKVAEKYLSGEIHSGDSVSIGASNNELKYTIKK